MFCRRVRYTEPVVSPSLSDLTERAADLVVGPACVTESIAAFRFDAIRDRCPRVCVCVFADKIDSVGGGRLRCLQPRRIAVFAVAAAAAPFINCAIRSAATAASDNAAVMIQLLLPPPLHGDVF